MLAHTSGRSKLCVWLVALLAASFGSSAMASEEVLSGPMTNAKLEVILRGVADHVAGNQGAWVVTVRDMQAQVITDENADRMRIIVAVVPVDDLQEGQQMRLLQANFETALDARYAVAQGIVWSTFIHPLSPLQPRQLLSGLAQTLTLAETFGTLYTSSGLSYGGGDHAEPSEAEPPDAA